MNNFGFNSPNYFNRTDGNSNVGVQAGSVSGSSIYTTVIGEQHVRWDTTDPDDLFKRAVDLLMSNIPRRAEPIIKWLVDKRAYPRTCRVAYYWTLAVLSGRTYAELAEYDYQVLDDCSTIVAENGDNVNNDGESEWRAPLKVVFELLPRLIGDSGETLDEAQLDAMAMNLSKLEEERREEILWHLSMIIDGAMRDHLDARRASELKDKRMRNNRIQRAWKFFEPIPEPPRKRLCSIPEQGPAKNFSAGIGFAVASLGFVASLSIYGTSNIAATLAVLIFFGIGIPMTAYFGAIRYAARERIADEDRRHGVFRPITRYTKRYTNWAVVNPTIDQANPRAMESIAETRQRFTDGVQPLVTYWFYNVAPPRNESQKHQAWLQAIGPMIQPMVQDIFELYSNPVVEPGRISWLIHRRVKEIRRKWENGTLYEYRQRFKNSPSVHFGFFGGLTAVGFGYLVVLGGFSINPGLTTLTILLLAFAVWILRASTVDRFAVNFQRNGLDRRDEERRFNFDDTAYRQWCEVLSDRPRDREIAEWLELDKEFLTRLAIRLYGISYRDLIIAPLALIEPDAKNFPSRARVVGHAPRYSRILVTLFLLTNSGVRQVTYDLDFYSGQADETRRMNFSYEAIAHAEVRETSAGLDREFTSPGHTPSGASTPPNGRLVLSHSFTVALNDQTTISVRVENFNDGFLDRLQEDERTLFDLALDPSGITSASRILEAVAVEGQNWIQIERDRLSRRLRKYSRGIDNTGRGLLLAESAESDPRDLEPEKVDSAVED